MRDFDYSSRPTVDSNHLLNYPTYDIHNNFHIVDDKVA